MMSSLLVAIVLVAALILTGAIFIVRSMFLPSRGKRIGTYMHPRKALVVMDLQEGYSGAAPGQPATTPPAVAGFFATVNLLIDHAAEAGMEVAYIRQVFSSNLIVRLHGGRRMAKVIVDRRVKVINGNDFAKNRTDAFSSRDFEKFLIDRQVNELYLVGADAAFCIYCTGLGGVGRGYGITVISDAVVSRRPLAEVFDRYRRKGIRVMHSSEFVQ